MPTAGSAGTPSSTARTFGRDRATASPCGRSKEHPRKTAGYPPPNDRDRPAFQDKAARSAPIARRPEHPIHGWLLQFASLESDFESQGNPLHAFECQQALARLRIGDRHGTADSCGHRLLGRAPLDGDRPVRSGLATEIGNSQSVKAPTARSRAATTRARRSPQAPTRRRRRRSDRALTIEQKRHRQAGMVCRIAARLAAFGEKRRQVRRLPHHLPHETPHPHQDRNVFTMPGATHAGTMPSSPIAFTRTGF
jgi:hypothetical protein